MPPPLGASYRVLGTSPLFSLCAFACPAGAPAWSSENQTGAHVAIAFARAPVGIRPEGGRTLIADRTAAMLYNPHQRYRREILDARGDNCLFLALRPDVAGDAFALHDERARERALGGGAAPCAHSRVRVDAGVTRDLARLAAAASREDPDAFESAGVRLLDIIARAHAAGCDDACAPETARAARTRSAHADLVERTLAEIARTARDNVPLPELARRVHSSPFHLARVFRAHTGRSIAEHRADLRAREAALELASTDATIAAVAHATGYAHHAHMTSSFKRAFGVTPSAFRRSLGERRTSRILKDIERTA